MKRYFEGLTTVLLAGTLFLGTGGTLAAQDVPPASQQPMEIPAPYPHSSPVPADRCQGPGPQQQPNAPQQGDPGAARVSFMHGDVSTQHSGSNDWAAVTLNTPVVSWRPYFDGQGLRAEIQLDHANILRMSDESAANVVIPLAHADAAPGRPGPGELRGSEKQRRERRDRYAQRGDSPANAGEGSFRIEVNSDGETIVDVRKGSAEISTPQGSTHVERDQRITIQGNADNAQYQVSGAPGRDDWDKWNSDRDHTIESAQKLAAHQSVLHGQPGS
jgi:hypothetical protein